MLGLALQSAALCRELRPPLGQLPQADHLGLVGVEQPGVGAAQPVEVRHQPQLGRLLAGCVLICLRGEVPELGGQLVGNGKQVADVTPDRPLQSLAVDAGSRARLRPAGPDAVLAAARLATAARLARLDVFVAVRVGGAGVDRVGEDVVNGPWLPPRAGGRNAAARDRRSGA